MRGDDGGDDGIPPRLHRSGDEGSHGDERGAVLLRNCFRDPASGRPDRLLRRPGDHAPDLTGRGDRAIGRLLQTTIGGRAKASRSSIRQLAELDAGLVLLSDRDQVRLNGRMRES